MSRVVVTGIGSVTGAGIGVASLRYALEKGSPVGRDEEVETLRGGTRTIQVSRIGSFDREAFLSSRRLRRMSEASQIWVISCLLARTDAGLDDLPAQHRPAPEKCGIFAGTGFGSTDVTWDYVQGMLQDGPGMANPFLFSESVANAPAGHAAIDLDLRGTNVTITSGDASATTALYLAARAIRSGKLDMAWCGGFEVISEPLLRVIGALGSIGNGRDSVHIGEGSICLVIESLETAKKRGTRIYAELVGTGLTSDPRAGATQWSTTVAPHQRAMRRAIRQARGVEDRPVSLTKVLIPSTDGNGAVREAAASLLDKGTPVSVITSVLGAFTAGGGVDLAAGVIACDEDGASGDHVMVNASSWGGTIVSHVLRNAGNA